MNTTTYIEPSIRTNSKGTLVDFFNSDQNHNSHPLLSSKHSTPEQLINKKRLFVFGEPGFGKSRLLKELLIQHEELGHQCTFIDLKKTKDGILNYIESHQSDTR